MIDSKEYRTWVRAVTKLSTATNLMDDVTFLGIDPGMREECRGIWDRMDRLKHRMVRKVEEMEKEMEG